MAACKNCGGSGKCVVCGGTGKVLTGTCPVCYGTKECRACTEVLPGQMGACRIAYYLLGHDYGSVKPEQIASINTSIAEWLAQGWSVLSVTPYGAGGTTAHLIITYTRRPAS